jgi:hypothetical protein
MASNGIIHRGPSVSIDEQHVALPKLYGAPAYARPVAVVDVGERPFDPDDLPIEAAMTEEDRALAASLPARAWAPGGAVLEMPDGSNGTHTSTGLTPRSFSLRAIAGRLLGGD